MSNKGFTYTLKLDAEISDLIAKTKQVKQSMKSIMEAGKAPGAEKIFDSIDKALEKLQSKASQPITSIAEFENLKKDATNAGLSVDKLSKIIEDLGKMSVADKMDLLPPDLKKQVEEVSTALSDFGRAQTEAAKKSEELVTAEKDLAAAQKELKKAEGRVNDKKALVEAQQQAVKSAQDEKKAIEDKIAAVKKYQETAKAYDAAGGDKRKAGGGKKELEGMSLPADRAAAQKAVPGLDLNDASAVEATLARLNEEYVQASKNATDAENAQRRYSNQLNDAQNAATVASGKVATLSGTVSKLNAEFEQNKAKDTQAAYTQLRTEAGKLGVDLTNIPVDYTEQNFQELNAAMNQLVSNGVAQVDAGLNKLQTEMGETSTAATSLGNGMDVAKEEITELDQRIANTTAFASRVKQFVGIQGAMQLARRAMRQVIQVIGDLDKAMAEMAVVTNLEVGDYWEMLPEFTANANALGVSIVDAYKATTLYLQQGLRMTEAQGLANQTLKMARIAGLEASDATDKMTAALRGFNMELNEMSAERVSDVYSQLAAITASNVDEISTAMTKTASIASSAGMEFETTAAFLAQIIETTRETAETAGTALKTVIARFQELKKDPSEIGEIDGEVVDANKIETALRSVGVSLRDAQGQFRELDGVFLELAGKWDSLDTNTQRYIATIAAGSRQQSRFIAMMSDYSRTTELVEAANNSAGASQVMFAKTLETFETKVTRLKNSWNSFLLGITNSDIIKAGIDLLRGFMDAINSVTDALGAFSGAGKIAVLIAALYLGDRALRIFLASVKSGTSVIGGFGAVGRAAISSIGKAFMGVANIFRKPLKIKINADSMTAAKKASADYARETARLKQIELERATAAKAGRLGDAESAMYSQLAAEATENQSNAEKELMATLGLSNAQMQIYTGLQALGLSTESALVLTKAGINAQTLAQVASTTSLTAAQYGEQLAQNLQNASGLRVLATKLQLTIANWAQTTSEKAKEGSIWKSITATIAQTMANWGLQASMWPILVIGLLLLLVIGLIVLAIYAIIKAIENWKASQPDAQLAALEEKAQEAKKVAEETKAAYEELLSTKTDYDELVTAVEEATEGTTAWKEAVSELNDQVQELISTYPALAAFVTTLDNGVMVIEEEGWEQVLGDYEKKANTAQAHSFVYQAKVAEKKKEISSNKKERQAAELQKKAFQKQALAAVGSRRAQQDKNYNRIIDSFAPRYDYLYALTEASAKGRWETDGEMWENGKDDTKGALEDELARYNISATGNEKKDMAALLAAKGGRAYTEDEIEDMGKGADNTLAKELEEIDATEDLGERFVDKVYQLQKDNATLGELYSGSLDIDIAAAKTEIKDLWSLEDEVKKALENRLETVEQGRKDIDLELQKIYKDSSINAEGFAGGYDQAQEFVRTYQEMLSGVGAGMATTFADMFANFDPEQQKEFFANFGDVKWSSSIEGAAKLKEMLEGTNEALRDFAAKTMALEQSTYSATAQMNEFYKTLSEDTLKELAEDGKITATEMLEMAKSNEKLATMLDTTGVSAAVLSRYYELLAEGTIYAYEATTNFIAALDDLNAASNAIEDSFAFIDTFEPARSQTEISEYFAEMKESAMELYEMGAYGDQQLKDYITTFLGEENWQSIIDKNRGDVQAAMDEAMQQINSYGTNLYGAWQTLVKQGLEGVSMGKDGSIQFDMTKIGDMEQLKQQIQSLGWSETMTEALIADAQTFSTNLQDGLDQLGVQKAFETWLSEAFSINGKTVIPKGQVEAMAKELGVTFDQLRKDLEEQGISVGEWITEDGQIGADFADLREQLIKDAEAAGQFDLDTNYQLLLELGLDDAAAKEELKTMAESLENVPFSVNGETIQHTGNVLNSTSELAIEAGSSEGLIDGLVDPKVKSAQELAAIEQGEMMAQANATGSLVATTLILSGAAQGVDTLVAKTSDILKYVGIKIPKTHLASTIANSTNGLIDTAIGQIAERNASRKAELNKNINSKAIETADTDGIIENLADKYTTETDEIIKAYNNSNAQAAGVTEFEAWENPYDELYNLNHKLNTLIKERERLERNYERAAQLSVSTMQELADITANELLTLDKEAELQRQIQDTAKQNIQDKMDSDPKYAKYYSYDEQTNTLQVDWRAADAAGWNADEGADFEDFISYLEEQIDVINEAEDSINDIRDDVEEVSKRGREATSDIYSQVKEGLVKQYEDQLTELENINESIQEAQEALVSKIQEQIDENRQARENEKAEQEITDKEMRLAYLMRDTSGGNATEIAELQQEIEEAKESYSDSLVDQAIENLEKENEKAAEQRERQIELQRAQLEAYTGSSKIWEQVKNLVDEGFAYVAQGGSFANTKAGQLAADGEEIEEKNPIEKEDFYNELERSAKEGAIYEGFASITGKDGKVQTIGELADSIQKTIDGVEMTFTPLEDSTATITTSLTAYKTGGLADFTGPAWLDGTKSKPEIILNQTDSANFIQLRDILADILQGTSSISNNSNSSTNGDNYYDIEISVDSLGSDYDVEQLADKIRSMIYEDAIYRNVNAVSTR